MFYIVVSVSKSVPVKLAADNFYFFRVSEQSSPGNNLDWLVIWIYAGKV